MPNCIKAYERIFLFISFSSSSPLPIGAYFAIIIALAVIVLGLFLVATFYQGCLCFKDKGYKDRRRQRTPKHIPKRLRPDAHMVQNNKNYQKVSTKHSNEMPRFALPAYNPTVKLPPTEEHVPLCEIINTETKVNLSENENEMQKRKRRKEAEVLKLKVEPDIHLENDSESISQSLLPAEEVNSESVNHHDTSDRNPEEHVVEINENTNRTIQSRPLPRNQGVQRESDVRTPTVQEPIERTQRNQQPIERLQINQQPIERVHRNEQLIERTQQIEQPAARAERIQPSFERDLRTQQPTETATRQPRLSQTLVRQSSSPPHIMPVDDEAPPPYEGVVGRPRRGHRRTNSGLNVL